MYHRLDKRRGKVNGQKVKKQFYQRQGSQRKKKTQRQKHKNSEHILTPCNKLSEKRNLNQGEM